MIKLTHKSKNETRTNVEKKREVVLQSALRLDLDRIVRDFHEELIIELRSRE